MQSIRGFLDNDHELVFEGGWDRFCRQGWRWDVNAHSWDLPRAKVLIEAAQRVHGVRNVTIGHPFNETKLRPVNDPSGASFGIYIRDVDDQLAALRENFEVDPRNWKGIPEPVSGDDR